MTEGWIRLGLMTSQTVGSNMTEIARLPGPVEHAWTWQRSGACRDLGPESFFHPEGERGPARRNRASAAKSVCDACPVLRPVSYTHLRAHETVLDLVCRLLLEKKK